MSYLKVCRVDSGHGNPNSQCGVIIIFCGWGPTAQWPEGILLHMSPVRFVLLGLIRGCDYQVLAVSTSEPAWAGHGSDEAHVGWNCFFPLSIIETRESLASAKAGTKWIFTEWQTKPEIEKLCTSVFCWWRVELQDLKHGLNFLPVHFLFAYFFSFSFWFSALRTPFFFHSWSERTPVFLTSYRRNGQ